MDMKEFIDTIKSTGQRMILDHEMVANWCEHFMIQISAELRHAHDSS